MVAAVIGDNTGDDHAGTEDAHMITTPAGDNYGGCTDFRVYKFAVGNHAYGLLSFSGISNLPSTLTVSSAIINLYVEASSGAGSHTITFKRALRNWTEGTSCSASGVCNFNQWATSSNWTTAGGLSDGNDRSATVSDTMTGVTTTFQYYSANDSAQIIADVEDFADGTLTNYGWHSERTDAADDSTYRFFTSSEGTDGQRPYIAVTYTTGGVTIPILAHHYNHNTGSHL